MKKIFVSVLVASVIVFGATISPFAAISPSNSGHHSGNSSGSSSGGYRSGGGGGGGGGRVLRVTPRGASSASSTSGKSSTANPSQPSVSDGVVAKPLTEGRVVDFAQGEGSTAGLPEAVVKTINAINAGTALSTVMNNKDLEQFKSLVGTKAIISKDTEGKILDKEFETVLTVPNLVEGITVLALYYDNNTGNWLTIVPVVDYNAKTVRLKLPGSGTLALIYK